MTPCWSRKKVPFFGPKSTVFSSLVLEVSALTPSFLTLFCLAAPVLPEGLSERYLGVCSVFLTQFLPASPPFPRRTVSPEPILSPFPSSATKGSPSLSGPFGGSLPLPTSYLFFCSISFFSCTVWVRGVFCFAFRVPLLKIVARRPSVW